MSCSAVSVPGPSSQFHEYQAPFGQLASTSRLSQSEPVLERLSPLDLPAPSERRTAVGPSSITPKLKELLLAGYKPLVDALEVWILDSNAAYCIVFSSCFMLVNVL